MGCPRRPCEIDGPVTAFAARIFSFRTTDAYKPVNRLVRPQCARRAQLRPLRKRQRSNALSMSWKPAGLLREAVEIKKVEVDLMEETLTERPDHPVNLRRTYYATRPNHRFSNALRRRDGTLSVVAAVKRFQPAQPGEKAELIADLDNIGRETRALEVSGVDAALFYTDSLRYGVTLAEMARSAHELKNSTQDFGMPLARLDLIIDPVQIAEAAESGACAVNIVAAAALPDIPDLLDAATAMGIEAVVECHTELERDYALENGATIVFLTNFDRTRNRLIPGTAERLVQDTPPWVMKLGGGGLRTAGDCWDCLDAGFNGVVLGRTLLQTRRTSGFIAEIRSQKRFTGDVFAGGFGMPFSEDMEA